MAFGWQYDYGRATVIGRSTCNCVRGMCRRRWMSGSTFSGIGCTWSTLASRLTQRAERVQGKATQSKRSTSKVCLQRRRHQEAAAGRVRQVPRDRNFGYTLVRFGNTQEDCVSFRRHEIDYFVECMRKCTCKTYPVIECRLHRGQPVAVPGRCPPAPAMYLRQIDCKLNQTLVKVGVLPATDRGWAVEGDHEGLARRADG